MIMRATQKKRISYAGLHHAGRVERRRSGVSSGQPRVENGHSPEENHVSRTSVSCRARTRSALGQKRTLSSSVTIIWPSGQYHAGCGGPTRAAGDRPVVDVLHPVRVHLSYARGRTASAFGHRGEPARRSFVRTNHCSREARQRCHTDRNGRDHWCGRRARGRPSCAGARRPRRGPRSYPARRMAALRLHCAASSMTLIIGSPWRLPSRSRRGRGRGSFSPRRCRPLDPGVGDDRDAAAKDGRIASRPTRSRYRSSSGCTAVSPSIVSGRVVATLIIASGSVVPSSRARW